MKRTMTKGVHFAMLLFAALAGLSSCSTAQTVPKASTFSSREIIFRKPEVFDLILDIPRRAVPDRVTMKVTGETLSESQKGEYLDKLLRIGDVYAEVKGYVSGRLTVNHMELESPAIFYLSQPTEHVNSLTITPVEEVVGGDRRNAGETLNRYYIEVIGVDKVGEVGGNLLKRLSDLRFEIGKPNLIPIGVSSEEKVSVALKMGLEGGHDRDNEDDYITIRARGGEGRFTMNVQLLLSPTYRYLWDAKVLSDPDITIKYGPYPTDLEIKVKGKSLWSGAGPLIGPVDLSLPVGDVEDIINENSKMTLSIHSGSAGLVKVEDIRVRFK
jgi:hypothetical protein